MTASAVDLYGLRVGARWTYLRSGDVLRWKEITACEEVPLLDIETGELRTQRAYVRENRGLFGTTSVHYLIADESGVLRVRRDDVDEGNLVVFTVYEPPSPRLLEAPYAEGDLLTFDLRTAEWDAQTGWFRGFSDTSAVDEVLEPVDLTTFAGTFPTLGVARQWRAFNAHRVTSRYAAGVGEVLEETAWPNDPIPQVEELVEYVPGYGSCEPGGHNEDVDCTEPLLRCDDAWETGVAGCTDPRVDPGNCGGCGVRCPGGVCAGGHCVEPECNLPCAGTTVCCPSAWGWTVPGCTSPARDRWNCGGCGITCEPGLICDRGQCVCGPGTRDCGAGTCEGVLDDALNCGECGRTCTGDRPLCDQGACVASCLSVDLVECGGACVDLSWSDLNCGACGRACGRGHGTTACLAGACVTCEQAGLTDCAETCVNLSWSDAHCGACGHACGDGEVCLFGTCTGGDGTCAEPCTEGDQICCGGECVDPRTNDHHCGGCGVDQCIGGCTQACRDGLCVGVDCGGGDD